MDTKLTKSLKSILFIFKSYSATISFFFLALLTDCTYSRSLTICCIFLNKNSKLFPKLSSSGLIGCLLHKLYGSAGKTKSSVYKVPTTKSTFEEELDWIGYGSL